MLAKQIIKLGKDGTYTKAVELETFPNIPNCFLLWRAIFLGFPTQCPILSTATNTFVYIHISRSLSVLSSYTHKVYDFIRYVKYHYWPFDKKKKGMETENLAVNTDFWRVLLYETADKSGRWLRNEWEISRLLCCVYVFNFCLSRNA